MQRTCHQASLPAHCFCIAPDALRHRSQVNICIGYVMPLFVAYIVEYRKKIDFMRHHWRTRHEFAASSLAPGGLLAYEHGVRYIVTCCLLLLNVLMLINVAVVAVVTHMNATLSE